LLVLFAAFGVALTEAWAQRPGGGPAMSVNPSYFGSLSGSSFPGMGMYPMAFGSGGFAGGYGGYRGIYGGYGNASAGYGNLYGGNYGNMYGGYGNAYGGALMSAYTQGQQGDQQPGHNPAEAMLNASGVSTDGGRVQWPLAVRLLGPPDGDRLRRQAEALLEVAALQAQNGQVNAQIGREIKQTAEELRRLLRGVRDRVPLAGTTFEEAELFLDKVKKAPEVLAEAMTAPPGGYGQLQATGQAPVPQPQAVTQVAVSDNAFEPRVITVAVGATVRWTNQGSHHHTVTADAGQWDSGKLDPRATYNQTFTQPGTYPYHCGVHPQEMRGVVIVK